MNCSVDLLQADESSPSVKEMDSSSSGTGVEIDAPESKLTTEVLQPFSRVFWLHLLPSAREQKDSYYCAIFVATFPRIYRQK